MIKTDISDIYKTESGALINTNDNKLLAYKKQKQHFRKIENMNKKIHDLENRIIQLEQMLLEQRT